jgi:hypothetical protein
MHKRKFKYGSFKEIQRSSVVDPNDQVKEEEFGEWLYDNENLFEDKN